VRDGKNDDWDQVKLKCLRNTKLTEEMMSLDMSSITSAQAGRADKVIAGLKKESKLDGEELVEWVSKKSGPCAGLWSWCVATQACYDIFKDVAPKKKKAAEMQVKSDKMNKELADIHASLARLDASLAKLNKEKAEKTAILERLEEQAAVMAKRLHSASKLISGLGGEQVRWTDDMHQFQEDKIKLVGDCLSASSFLSYCGPFNYALRQKMMLEDWKKDIVEKGIPNKDTFALDQFLTNDVEVSKWGA
jgi:dynein heavy chain